MHLYYVFIFARKWFIKSSTRFLNMLASLKLDFFQFSKSLASYEFKDSNLNVDSPSTVLNLYRPTQCFPIS